MNAIKWLFSLIICIPLCVVIVFCFSKLVKDINRKK